MTNNPMDPGRSHRLARLLRHEVGDLLQSVYSTVAVLMERMPAEMTLERRLIGELKNRAELCKSELEAVVELAGGQTPAAEPTDLGGTFAAVLAQVRRRYPALEVSADHLPTCTIRAEPRLLSVGLWLLLVGLCQSARAGVRIGFQAGERHVDCYFERDGHPASAEQLAWIHTPFATTQQAVFGLGLALARHALLGRGEIQAENRSPGGVVVRIRFPVGEDA